MYVITGGGTGIGRALAHALANRQKEVLIVGRRESMLVETANFSPAIHYLCADISTSIGREGILEYLKEQPFIEGLIHNAGTIDPIAPMQTLSEEAWQQVLAINLNAPLFLTQSLYSKLSQGRVLHMGSGVAHFPVKGWSAYCVSKAALYMLTRCWQIETQDVAVTSVMPGIIDTDMQAYIRDSQQMDEEKNDFFKRLKAENKLISPETVALFLCWLLLDIEQSEYVSKEWDIYDTSHHADWLVAPHKVPFWE